MLYDILDSMSEETESVIMTQEQPAAPTESLLPSFVAKLITIVVTLIGIIGAGLSYMLGTMYGFDVDAGRRTDQWLSVIIAYAASGAFLAFPVYLAGSYTNRRRWRLFAVGIFGAVSLLFIIMWLM